MAFTRSQMDKLFTQNIYLLLYTSKFKWEGQAYSLRQVLQICTSTFECILIALVE